MGLKFGNKNYLPYYGEDVWVKSSNNFLATREVLDVLELLLYVCCIWDSIGHSF